MWYLAGDIGGTHTRLLAIEQNGDRKVRRHAGDYDSQDATGLIPILQQFIAEYGLANIDSACFAVAGPVQGESAKITNLPWHIHLSELKSFFGTDAVQLINDFSGVAHGVSQVSTGDLRVLQAATAQTHGTRMVLGAGTGLGMAIIEQTTDDEHVIETEAGHIGFAPADEEQLALLIYWRERLERVTNETFLSGKGIARIFDFYRSRSPDRVARKLLDEMQHDDPAKVINIHATRYKDPVAMQSMQCFADIYASVAGDMALACKATGGVYLAGGIAPTVMAYLQTDRFLQRYNNKAPMQALMAIMPVYVVLNTSVGLLGAMKLAMSVK